MANNFYSQALKFGGVVLFSALIFVWVGYLQGAPETSDEPKIQATLNLNPEKIQPNTPVELSVRVFNAGEVPTPEGQLYVRYSLVKPLNNKDSGTIFESEKQPLNSLQPGQEVVVSFKNKHQLPTVIDFIRDDWLMHEYQVVFLKGKEEKIVSTLPLTFSAQYYPVFKQKTPAVSL